MIVIEAIPYKTFREKCRIVSYYRRKKAKVEVFKDFVYVEKKEIYRY